MNDGRCDQCVLNQNWKQPIYIIIVSNFGNDIKWYARSLDPLNFMITSMHMVYSKNKVPLTSAENSNLHR